MRKKIPTIQKRRKKEGKTNYKKRLRLLLSKKPRLVIRLTLGRVTAQLIVYQPEGDKVIVSANSKELEEHGWKFNKGNLSSAYLTGLLIGAKAKKHDVKEAVLDIGFRNPTKGSKIFACLKGAVDAGLNIPCSKEIFPSEDRIKGKHIVDYAALLKENKAKYEKQFSKYIKDKLDPAQMTNIFEETKKKILKVE